MIQNIYEKVLNEIVISKALNNLKVIGIHYGGSKQINFNFQKIKSDIKYFI